MNYFLKISAIILLVFITHLQALADILPDSTTQKTTINRSVLTAAGITQGSVYLGGMAFLQYGWYHDHQKVPFHFYNDNKGYLQMDKLGHSFAAYSESYLAYRWYRKAGLTKNQALLYGGGMGLLLQTPIEVFDALYEGWGFSWGDMLANAAGCLLMTGQELVFNEQLARFKMSFYPSEMSYQVNGYLGNNVAEKFLYDYNSHTFWLSFNANRLGLQSKLPPWLNVALGYSANGMLGEFENRSYYRGVRLPEYDRTRQFLLSLDLDWEKIPSNSKILKGLFTALNYVKVPFPALEINSKGKFRTYWCYF